MIMHGDILSKWTRSNNTQFNDAPLNFGPKKATNFMDEKYDFVLPRT